MVEAVKSGRLKAFSGYLDAVQSGASVAIALPVEPALINKAVIGYRDYLSQLAKNIDEVGIGSIKRVQRKEAKYGYCYSMH